MRSTHVYCEDKCKSCVNSIAAQPSRSRQSDYERNENVTACIRSNCVVNAHYGGDTEVTLKRYLNTICLASCMQSRAQMEVIAQAASQVCNHSPMSELSMPQLTDTSQLDLISFQNLSNHKSSRTQCTSKPCRYFQAFWQVSLVGSRQMRLLAGAHACLYFG